jgi:hypothetical protein
VTIEGVKEALNVEVMLSGGRVNFPTIDYGR